MVFYQVNINIINAINQKSKLSQDNILNGSHQTFHTLKRKSPTDHNKGYLHAVELHLAKGLLSANSAYEST